ncbi:hypothetical protein EVAR_13302_1 [Eumeta japonica]|uniref:Uncharacterized protein n=1 Tax=Eumeta variegata TaxID=151549 RepID=A0A4C1TS17_EUMVA|nr:hypothetical protein EVAR_13302_1 [Eumeta japonica]
MTSRLQTRLTFHRCSYQPRQDSGRERAGGSGILGSPEVSADILELIRAKTQLAPREHPHSRVQIQSASQREVKARVRNSEMRATSWRKSNHPTKRFGQLPKRSKPRDIPYTPTQNLIIQGHRRREIAECLADSIETQCSRFPSARHRSYQSHRGRGSPNLPRTQRRSGSRLTQRSPNASEIT